jgi:ketosteroid isomerase-like protein
MKPMEWLPQSEPWWPEELGQPSSAGGQNDIRYAFFPHARRLLDEQNGEATTYDTGDHQIDGVSQRNSGGLRSLTFTSQNGPVRLAELTRIG